MVICFLNRDRKQIAHWRMLSVHILNLLILMLDHIFTRKLVSVSILTKKTQASMLNILAVFLKQQDAACSANSWLV